MKDGFNYVGVINRNFKLLPWTKITEGALCLIFGEHIGVCDYWWVMLDFSCDVTAQIMDAPAEWIEVLGKL